MPDGESMNFAARTYGGKNQKLGISRGLTNQSLQRHGRMDGIYAAGPGGVCVCHECGYKNSHQAGHPCYRMKCPRCGAVMTRG